MIPQLLLFVMAHFILSFPPGEGQFLFALPLLPQRLHFPILLSLKPPFVAFSLLTLILFLILFLTPASILQQLCPQRSV